MKTRILLVLAIVLVLAIAGSASVAATTGDLAPAAGRTVVPFRAHYQTYPQPVGPPVGGILTLAIPGDGLATNLGLDSWYADSQVDLTQTPNLQTGDMVFTAANGDQIFGTFTGIASSPPGVINFSGTYEITGGTGRFEGVTGSGDYWGSAEGDEGELTFDGTLTLDPPAVPFRAHYQTTCEWVGDDTAGSHFIVQGEGRATHLGKSAFYAESVIDFSQYPSPSPYWSEVTLTAANGDELYVTQDGYVSENEVSGTFYIIGGTGRFEGVGGIGDFWGWIEPTEEIYYNGTLTK